MEHGVEKFIDDMMEYGFGCEVDDGLVVFEITPIEGAHAGGPIATGVSTAELDPWPQVPPHWIHLHASITFPKTNSKPSSRSGWLRHSRDLVGWGDAPPAIGWTSHVRAALSEAIE